MPSFFCARAGCLRTGVWRRGRCALLAPVRFSHGFLQRKQHAQLCAVDNHSRLWMKLLVVCCDSYSRAAPSRADPIRVRKTPSPLKPPLRKQDARKVRDGGSELSRWRSPSARRFASGAAGEDGAPASRTSRLVLVVDPAARVDALRRKRATFRRRSSAMTSRAVWMPDVVPYLPCGP